VPTDHTFLALTRDVTPAIVNCELTHLAREPIDYPRAVAQHEHYQQVLAGLGCRIELIPSDPAQPDSVFIEDTAVVVEELGVITRPGAESRRGETRPVAAALQRHRRLSYIRAPGTLDGGDVLRAGRLVFVGITSRTNSQGVTQLREALEPEGYTVSGVPVRGCLHLKSAATEVADGLLLINPLWADRQSFPGFEFVEVDPGEPNAGNALRLGRVLVHGADYPRTRARLEAEGLEVHPVDLSELAKAEGAVTCCSLILPA
jgi:dimethylargininase